jgi:hypothetical protein
LLRLRKTGSTVPPSNDSTLSPPGLSIVNPFRASRGTQLKDQPMQKNRSVRALAALSVLLAHAAAATIEEDFSTDPLTRGWSVFGDATLFQWDAANHNLRVTWDSSKTNSYFHHPLGTILTRDDDFSVAFDLRVDDIGAASPSRSYSFPIAIGFQNYGDATRPDFVRGTGFESPNVVELAYFRDSGFGATVWPSISDTNSAFNWNSASDYAVYELTPADWYRVVMVYSASNHTMTTTITNLTTAAGFVIETPLSEFFSDFRVNTLSISSYSDAGQDPTWGEGSVLAEGAVDNLRVTVPAPPIQHVVGALANGAWELTFSSRTNWLYTLVRSTDFASWSEASAPTNGNGGNLVLQDTNAVSGNAFYRVRAERP